MAKIVPTILTDDEEEYHKRLLRAEHVSDLIQIDLVDGKFASCKTVSANVIKKYLSSSFLEIHLMVRDPQNYIDDLMSVEHISRLIVPFEGESGLPEVIYHIKNHDKQVGISINPETPVGAVFHLLDDIDLLLLLAVKPGFSGQKLNENVFSKVREVKKTVPGLAVEVDGGVNFDNVAMLAASGVDFLATNSVLYNSDDFYLAYEKLAKLASNPR